MPLPKRQQVDVATKLIAKLSRDKFYGEMYLKFEHGNIVHIRQTLNVKVEDVEKRLLDPSVSTSGGGEEFCAPVTTRDG